jgi:hypothetical protein
MAWTAPPPRINGLQARQHHAGSDIDLTLGGLKNAQGVPFCLTGRS